MCRVVTRAVLTTSRRITTTSHNADIYGLTNGTFSSARLGNLLTANFTTYLTGGTYNVVAHYTGDGTYGGSD